MEQYAPGVPYHLVAVALHEAGHTIAALVNGLLPCRARVWINDDGTAQGDVHYNCHRNYPTRTPRQRAIVSAAGVAASRLYLDCSDGPCILTPSDLKGIAGERMKPADVMPDAVALCREHRLALHWLTIALAKHRELRADALMKLVASDAEMKTVRDAWSAAK